MEQRILRVAANLDILKSVRDFIEDSAALCNFSLKESQELIQAVDEAMTNIIQHGYRGEPEEIEIVVAPTEDGLWVHLRDHAYAFDPTTLPQPDLSVSLENRPVGKMGMMFIRQFVDNMSYQRQDGRINQLSLFKKGKIRKNEVGS